MKLTPLQGKYYLVLAESPEDERRIEAFVKPPPPELGHDPWAYRTGGPNQLLVTINVAKAIGLPVVREAPPHAVWVRRGAGDFIFDPLYNPAHLPQVITAGHVDVQWRRVRGGAQCRARVMDFQWNAEDIWGKDLAFAVCYALAHKHAGAAVPQ